MTQKAIAELYQKGVNTINEHIKNIYSENELEENSTIRKNRIVENEGTRRVERFVNFYNLEMVLSIGYRVRSNRGTQFRRWATERDFSFDEIDSETVYRFIRSANNNGRLTVLNKDSSLEEIFSRLSLMENSRINNAGILLFGKNPQRYFDTARVRILHLKDNITIIGDKWASGNLFNQYQETEEAIKSYINVRYEIKGMDRTDIWDYPLEAIRETIANALLHRDYFRTVTTQIKVFDDKIWFFNPGGLGEDWTMKRLLGLHSSDPRNPIMFNIFYLAGLVESVGSGMGRIIGSLTAQKLPEPEFEVNHNEFIMIFEKAEVTPRDTPQVTPQDKIKRLLVFCSQPKSRDEMMREIEIKDRKHFVESYLNPLLEKGKLRRTIPDKPRSSKQKYITVQRI
jgi:ATP-dependent DNA helicase RecG